MSERMLTGIPLAAIRTRDESGNRVTHAPGTREQPAEPVELPEEEALRLAAMSPPAFRLVERESAGDDEKPAKMTRAELEERAELLEIDLAKIKGTGRNGALKNDDIAAAIAAAETARGSGNPSLAE